MSSKQFNFAVKLACLTAEIDDTKKVWVLPAQVNTVTECVEKLHAIAQVLAGERTGEIYDQTEEVAS